MTGKRRAAAPAAKKTAPKGRPNGAGKPSARRRIIKAAGVSALVLAILGALGFVVLYQAIDIPDPNRDFQTETSFVYYADGKTEVGRFATQNRNSIPLSEMPESIKDAVVAAEDQSFYTNQGIDPRGILRAAFSNAQGNDRQGASTITQQYVKILYLSQDQTYKRKIREAIMSLKLHRQQSKQEILEGYLNTIYFGRGAYGIDAAAHAFFDIPAAELNLRQSAVLASVLNNPTRFDPANGKENRKALKGRFQYVLGAMAETGAVPAGKAEKAAKRLPKFPEIEGEQQYGGMKGHALDLVKNELTRLGFNENEINGGGLRVYTTLSKNAMDAAAAGVAEVQPDGVQGLHTAVASVQPGTGALRGFYAGQDYLDSQINWALAGGQPGSSFKPFALAAGLKAGYSLKHRFQGNSPIEFPGGDSFKNLGPGEGQDYGAEVELLQATVQSINTAYIDLTASMPDGPEKVIDMANALGVPRAKPQRNDISNLHDSPGLKPNTGVALGSATVSPINMANAYATIANGGEAADLYVIEKVVDQNGETRYRHKVSTERVLDEDIAADVSYAMQQVVEDPDGSGTRAQALGRPAAGKTGTATFGPTGYVSSSWYVGYTPQMATAVMYTRGKGNETLEGFLEPFFGGFYPAMTWTAVMERLLEGEPVEEFPEPAFVEGDPPEDEHEPFTPPPPPPEPEPEPTRTTEEPSEDPTTEEPETEEPETEDPTPTPEPSPSCSDPLLAPPECEPSPSPTPTESESAGGGDAGGGGSGSGGGGGGGGNPATRERDAA